MTGKKVLIVDDEIHIVHVVAIKLRNNGYDVRIMVPRLMSWLARRNRTLLLRIFKCR